MEQQEAATLSSQAAQGSPGRFNYVVSWQQFLRFKLRIAFEHKSLSGINLC